MSRRKLRGLALGAALLSVCTAVSAQQVDDASRAAARDLGYEGVSLLKSGDYANASERLERAYRVLMVPSLGLWSARALVKIGKLVEAQERYLEATRLTIEQTDKPKVQVAAIKDSAKELEELQPRIPSLLLTVAGAPAEGVVVTIDDVRLPVALVGQKRLLNPGSHRIVATRGEARLEQSVTLAEGEAKSTSLTFPAAPEPAPEPPPVLAPPPQASPQPVLQPVAPPPSAQADRAPGSSGGAGRTLGWATFGAGVLGLGTGLVTGILVLDHKATIAADPNCYQGHCLHSEAAVVQEFNALRTATTISLVAGGALATVGLIVIGVSGSSHQEPRVGLRLSSTSADLVGSF